ncbi:MAG: hydrolase [Oscillospiraceae bacterium]|jgi:peptidoglycan/xylan/chitin deacetylase (PgdA/CDA1 family)|nr:hydrolase [Oscillospiraceae bacterium]
MKKLIAALCSAAFLTLSLTSCGDAGTAPAPDFESPAYSETPAEPTPDGTIHAIRSPAATEAISPAADRLVPYDGIVEHLFFHTPIAYTEQAFDGDSQEEGFDMYMVTVEEYKKILQSLYDKDYIIVNMNDVWNEYADESGSPYMKRETLMIPEGKKPIIISFDDISYYEYMMDNGFPYRLIIGRDGDIWSYGKDPAGNEVISQDIDCVTILDKFVKDHPDFSLGGAKGLICLTGYNGILGYRTQTDSKDSSPEFEARRQSEIARVKPIVKRLKDTGWYFASHSWGHINLNTASFSKSKGDADRWMAEVGSLIGPTKLMVYPFGSRLDGDDVTKTGEAFRYYHSLGFRVFASVGVESYSKIKKEISAVICDRMHSDGVTLRHERNRYMKFYDAAEVWDDARPSGSSKYTRDW